jgi:hypothetical protein
VHVAALQSPATPMRQKRLQVLLLASQKYDAAQ